MDMKKQQGYIQFLESVLNYVKSLLEILEKKTSPSAAII